MFYFIFTFSFLYSIYKLIIVCYYLIKFIVNVYTGKLIVRNSPVNSFNTIFRVIGNASKTTANFTIGTGVAYCLCHELDEILINDGKEPYFVPGMRAVIQNIGAEDYAKIVLLGIKDKIKNVKSITDILEPMSEDERNRYEKETGQSWENLYNEQKKLQEIKYFFIKNY